MQLTKWRRVLCSVALSITSTTAFAASDPTDPDCPRVQQIRDITRIVDLYNIACARDNSVCSALQERIDNDGRSIPNLMKRSPRGAIYFNPKAVFNHIGTANTDIAKEVFDCDPEDDDCDGQIINLPEIKQNLDQHGLSVDVLLNFPASNFVGARR